MVVIKKVYVKYLIVLIPLILMLMSCTKSNINKDNKIVDIYDVVKEAFLTDKGYSTELSKHVSEKVFKYTNIYNVYSVNDPKYIKPFEVDFSLKEDSQEAEKDIVYVKMTYSVTIRDSKGKDVGGSKDIPITFTVKKTESDWCIIDKYEEA